MALAFKPTLDDDVLDAEDVSYIQDIIDDKNLNSGQKASLLARLVVSRDLGHKPIPKLSISARAILNLIDEVGVDSLQSPTGKPGFCLQAVNRLMDIEPVALNSATHELLINGALTRDSSNRLVKSN